MTTNASPSGVAGTLRLRHLRQARFSRVGKAGQRRLDASRVLVVGLGATGGAIAESLARAGVSLTLVDRDFPELHNLQRQTLLDHQDVLDGRPKALAAKRRLSAIDPELELHAHVVDLHAGNALNLAEGHDLIVDGTDNFPTRFVINDIALKLGIPWVYVGAVGAQGAVMPINAGGKPCLRCLHPKPPPAGSLETCDTTGVLQPAVAVAAGLAALCAMRFLLGEPPVPGLIHIDVWEGIQQRFALPAREDCPSCALRAFPALLVRSDEEAVATTLCGRDAVQVRPAVNAIDLEAQAERLKGLSTILCQNADLLRFEVDGLETTLFADGRAIVQGTDDPARARGHYARYIGL